MCKHENALLMGTADGIVCRGCGQVFKSLDEIVAAEPEPEAAPAKPKRAPRKKKEDA